jgi:hypothetical protein
MVRIAPLLLRPARSYKHTIHTTYALKPPGRRLRVRPESSVPHPSSILLPSIRPPVYYTTPAPLHRSYTLDSTLPRLLSPSPYPFLTKVTPSLSSSPLLFCSAFVPAPTSFSLLLFACFGVCM